MTIHVGDSVRFLPSGFHTVNIPARRGAKGPLPFFPPNGQKVAGALDAAGQPFWFNGQPQVGVNPTRAGRRHFGKRLTYTGKKRIESGVPGPSGPPKPMTVKFTSKGTLTYYCDVHPGMKATVVVRPKRRSIPTARQDAKALKKQYAKDLKVAKGLTGTTPPAGTVDLGSAGADGVEIFAMFPSTVTIPVGTTLKFQMSKGTYETHTATFGPGPAETPSTYLGQARGLVPGAGARPGGGVPERHAARAGHPHPDAPRQRVLELGHAGPRQGLADPVRERREVRRRGHVHVLLPHPPVHEGDGRRPVT